MTAYSEFNRRKVKMRPLKDRANKVRIEEAQVRPDDEPAELPQLALDVIADTAQRMRFAREHERARMLVFGAHTIKNGLSPTLTWLIDEGWITHMATNGAGVIHDWEFAFQGESSEDVRDNVSRGEFGAWEETGRYLNLALNVGAYAGLGYGESIGALVENEGLDIPPRDELKSAIVPGNALAGAAADLLEKLDTLKIKSGKLKVPHPFKNFGLQAAAFRLGIPFTGHPMFGHDIHYIHPMNCGAAIGRTAERDFLRFAHSVSELDGGVYLSIGSAVMSPMVFEKSLSMARNVAIQEGRQLSNPYMCVVDLAKSHWDWTQGEPPEDNPDYYLRYNKTFARMGGTMRYISSDNRDFLLTLVRALQE